MAQAAKTKVPDVPSALKSDIRQIRKVPESAKNVQTVAVGEKVTKDQTEADGRATTPESEPPAMDASPKTERSVPPPPPTRARPSRAKTMLGMPSVNPPIPAQAGNEASDPPTKRSKVPEAVSAATALSSSVPPPPPTTRSSSGTHSAPPIPHTASNRPRSSSGTHSAPPIPPARTPSASGTLSSPPPSFRSRPPSLPPSTDDSIPPPIESIGPGPSVPPPPGANKEDTLRRAQQQMHMDSSDDIALPTESVFAPANSPLANVKNFFSQTVAPKLKAGGARIKTAVSNSEGAQKAWDKVVYVSRRVTFIVATVLTDICKGGADVFGSLADKANPDPKPPALPERNSSVPPQV